MPYRAEDYADQLRRLMPRGKAWNFAPDGVLMRFLRSLGGLLARLDAREADLVEREIFPNTTLELLPEWETELGLPEPCRSEAETLADRRQALLVKLTNVGGQSKAYFIALAESLGLSISISEYRPFRLGYNRVGEPLNDDTWHFVWRVELKGTQISEFRVGEDTVGTPFRTWMHNEALECLLNRYKPAHTQVIVAYLEEDSANVPH